jgi:hypothetical protein
MSPEIFYLGLFVALFARGLVRWRSRKACSACGLFFNCWCDVVLIKGEKDEE